MHALVVFESIFGNTREVAEAVAAGLRDQLGPGAVDLVEVGEAPTSLEGVDMLVVGGPIHAWSMTRESTRGDAIDEAERANIEPVSRGRGIRDWLELLPKVDGAPRTAAAFDTAMQLRWIPSGSAAKPAAKRLRALGFELVAKPEHFFVAGRQGPLKPGEAERAREWAGALAAPAVETAGEPVPSPA